MGQASIPSLHGLLKIKDHIKDETYNLDGMSWELEVLFFVCFNYVHVVTGIGDPTSDVLSQEILLSGVFVIWILAFR